MRICQAWLDFFWGEDLGLMCQFRCYFTHYNETGINDMDI